MMKQELKHSHTINYDNLTRVAKYDVDTIKYSRYTIKPTNRGEKLYSYDDGEIQIYISAMSYDAAKRQLDLIFTKASDT